MKTIGRVQGQHSGNRNQVLQYASYQQTWPHFVFKEFWGKLTGGTQLHKIAGFFGKNDFISAASLQASSGNVTRRELNSLCPGHA